MQRDPPLAGVMRSSRPKPGAKGAIVMNKYSVCVSGGVRVCTITSKNLGDAAIKFMATLDKSSAFTQINNCIGSIRVAGNSAITSDYVIFRA